MSLGLTFKINNRARRLWPRGTSSPVASISARGGREALCEFFLGDFNCDITDEPRVTSLVDFAHTARTEQREDFVVTEFVADTERHMSGLAQFTGSESRLCLNHGASVPYFFKFQVLWQIRAIKK
jgi:hypothetical protein